MASFQGVIFLIYKLLFRTYPGAPNTEVFSFQGVGIERFHCNITLLQCSPWAKGVTGEMRKISRLMKAILTLDKNNSPNESCQ